jgi:hypothetical protein
MDTRFLELRRKNDPLKLALFWKAYNIGRPHNQL